MNKVISSRLAQGLREVKESNLDPQAALEIKSKVDELKDHGFTLQTPERGSVSSQKSSVKVYKPNLPHQIIQKRPAKQQQMTSSAGFSNRSFKVNMIAGQSKTFYNAINDRKYQL